MVLISLFLNVAPAIIFNYLYYMLLFVNFKGKSFASECELIVCEEELTPKQIRESRILRITLTLFAFILYMIIDGEVNPEIIGFILAVFRFTYRLPRLYVYFSVASSKASLIDLHFKQKTFTVELNITKIFFKKVLPLFFIHYIPMIIIDFTLGSMELSLGDSVVYLASLGRQRAEGRGQKVGLSVEPPLCRPSLWV